jgi:hypothetical protein
MTDNTNLPDVEEYETVFRIDGKDARLKGATYKVGGGSIRIERPEAEPIPERVTADVHDEDGNPVTVAVYRRDRHQPGARLVGIRVSEPGIDHPYAHLYLHPEETTKLAYRLLEAVQSYVDGDDGERRPGRLAQVR